MEEPQEIDQLSLTPTPTTAVESRRRICGGCNRPLNVCLCDKIPREPIPTTTQIVILQHPHEQRQKLATVPVIRKCLQNCQIIVGRKLRQGSSPLLDSLYHGHHHSRAVFLFPGFFIYFISFTFERSLDLYWFINSWCIYFQSRQ